MGNAESFGSVIMVIWTPRPPWLLRHDPKTLVSLAGDENNLAICWLWRTKDKANVVTTHLGESIWLLEQVLARVLRRQVKPVHWNWRGSLRLSMLVVCVKLLKLLTGGRWPASLICSFDWLLPSCWVGSTE